MATHLNRAQENMPVIRQNVASSKDLYEYEILSIGCVLAKKLKPARQLLKVYKEILTVVVPFCSFENSRFISVYYS